MQHQVSCNSFYPSAQVEHTLVHLGWQAQASAEITAESDHQSPLTAQLGNDVSQMRKRPDLSGLPEPAAFFESGARTTAASRSPLGADVVRPKARRARATLPAQIPAQQDAAPAASPRLPTPSFGGTHRSGRIDPSSTPWPSMPKHDHPPAIAPSAAQAKAAGPTFVQRHPDPLHLLPAMRTGDRQERDDLLGALANAHFSLKEQQAHQAVSPPGTADPPWIVHCGLLYHKIWMIACGDFELTA